jgi:hypothetical protein
MEQPDWFSERSESCSPDRATGPIFFKVEIFFSHYNKHLIDRSCSFQIGGYWSRTFFALYGLRLQLGPYKHTQKVPIFPYPDLTLGQ